LKSFRKVLSPNFSVSISKTVRTLLAVGVIIITFYNMGEGEEWENTKIINGKGVINAENQHIRSVVGSELLKIMERVKKAGDELSDLQKEKIKSKLLSSKDKLSLSAIYNELKKDFDLKNRQ